MKGTSNTDTPQNLTFGSELAKLLDYGGRTIVDGDPVSVGKTNGIAVVLSTDPGDLFDADEVVLSDLNEFTHS